MAIHPTAVISTNAEVDPTARIDPYAIIDGPVHVAADVHVYPHAYLTGWTHIGARSEIHPGAVVGHVPQDTKYTGARTYCCIGEETIIREGASIHRGTAPESCTVVGDRCFLMAGAHVAHDCVLGDRVTIVGGTLLGGHVQIGDGAFVGGGAAVHQFVRIGALAMIAGHFSGRMDIPPYFTADIDGGCAGVNVVGMRRAGMTPEQRRDVQRAFRTLYRSTESFQKRVAALAEVVQTDAGRDILAFVRGPSRRGIAGASRER